MTKIPNVARDMDTYDVQMYRLGFRTGLKLAEAMARRDLRKVGDVYHLSTHWERGRFLLAEELERIAAVTRGEIDKYAVKR